MPAQANLKPGSFACPRDCQEVMDQPDATRTVVVTNREGFHLRAATLFVSLARQFNSEIELSKDRRRVDGKSTPLQLVSLGAWRGDTLLLEAAGRDAQKALEALVALFASNFEEDPEAEQVGEIRPRESFLENDNCSE